MYARTSSSAGSGVDAVAGDVRCACADAHRLVAEARRKVREEGRPNHCRRACISEFYVLPEQERNKRTISCAPLSIADPVAPAR